MKLVVRYKVVRKRVSGKTTFHVEETFDTRSNPDIYSYLSDAVNERDKLNRIEKKYPGTN